MQGILLVLCGLVAFAVGQGEECNQPCMTEVMGKLAPLQAAGENPSELTKHCSTLPGLMKELGECIAKFPKTGCESMVAPLQQMNGMFSKLTDMVCSSKGNCSFNKIVSCLTKPLMAFGVEFKGLEDLGKLEKMQNIDENYFKEKKNRNQFCKYVDEVQPKKLITCLTTMEKKLTACMASMGAPQGGGPQGGASHLDQMKEAQKMFEQQANVTFICEPGCDEYLTTAYKVEGFHIDDNLVKEVKKDATEGSESCQKLKMALANGTNMVGGCVRLQKMLTNAVKPHTNVNESMHLCNLQLEFITSSGVQWTASFVLAALLSAFLLY